MSDLTIEEKMTCDAHRAREIAAEKHFYDANQPFFPLGFAVHYRNPGHWDVTAMRCPGKASAFMAANPGGSTSDTDERTERAFRIRGEPGNVVVYDERWNPHRGRCRPDLTFKSVLGAMLWIVEEMMQEPSAQKDQTNG